MALEDIVGFGGFTGFGDPESCSGRWPFVSTPLLVYSSSWDVPPSTNSPFIGILTGGTIIPTKDCSCKGEHPNISATAGVIGFLMGGFKGKYRTKAPEYSLLLPGRLPKLLEGSLATYPPPPPPPLNSPLP